MSYKKNSYLIVKNAIPIDVANFVYDYFNMKKRTFITLKETGYISKFDVDMRGTYKCHQVQVGSYTF